jgi:hypothetical protein
MLDPERLERGDLFKLLKLWKMGTLGVPMKGVLPWLFCWARRDSPRDFCPALAALVSPLPIAQLPGQVGVLGRLSLNMCLWLDQFQMLSMVLNLKARYS